MRWTAKDGNPIKLNGAFFTLCTILRFVVASAAKAKLGALFLNCKEDMIFWKTLEELSHLQPKTQVHCDNLTAVGIANNTVKRQRLRSMEMQFFWVCVKLAQDAYDLGWHPGQENLADYQSKKHKGTHHQAVHPWYLHESTPLWSSHKLLDQALWKGVLELYLKGTYITYPYLEYHESRLLSPIRLPRYLITMKTYV